MSGKMEPRSTLEWQASGVRSTSGHSAVSMARAHFAARPVLKVLSNILREAQSKSMYRSRGPMRTGLVAAFMVLSFAIGGRSQDLDPVTRWATIAFNEFHLSQNIVYQRSNT